MYVGRKLGWSFSKSVISSAPVPLAVAFAVVWGVAIAIAMHALINWQQPSLILRWVMGYALASYVAIPNYGLIGIPPGVDERREAVSTILSTVAVIAYIAAMCALSFFHVPLWAGSA